jgi:hypothetical protein
MAWDIESVAANWSSGVVGNGFLNRGHSDRSPQASLAITDATNAWSQTNNDDSDWGQKRTHTFSTGGVIWDLAGNLYEWVDWTTGGESFSVGPTTCDLYGPPYEVSCAALNPNDYLPLNPAGIDHAEYNHTNYNLGFIWGGDGGAILRGGSYLDNAVAGLYSLNFDNVPSFSYTAVGFRCACTAASGLIGP